MHRICASLILVGTLLAGPSWATTWGKTEVDDPISAGEKCDVHEPGSWGSYIYRWPSKYDFVFWPLTDVHGIWHCKHSGFTSFIGDFEGLSDSERTAISTYLAGNYDGKDDIETKLGLLEDIYALRNTDAEFGNKLLRVLARWYQNIGHLEKANLYRKKAFVDLKALLGTDLVEERKLEYLYLAANYSRQFGESAESDRYLEELRSAIASIEDPELSGFAEYCKR